MCYAVIERFRNDRIFTYLLKKGLLTIVQVDTILSSRGPGKLAQSVSLRNRKDLTKGAFIRSLRQGERNIESAFYTLLLIRYLHLMDGNTWARFVNVGNLMDQAGAEFIDPESVGRLLEAIENTVKGLSKNRNVIV